MLHLALSFPSYSAGLLSSLPSLVYGAWAGLGAALAARGDGILMPAVVGSRAGFAVMPAG